MPRIMISYRRIDSQAIAGRVFDRLVTRYGSDAVFMDIEGISYGVDFRKQIDNALRQSDIVIAIVGPLWLGPQTGSANRIAEPTDPIRIEIETAFDRKAVIIPTLVDKAKMPKEEDLPASLSQFSYLNALQLDAGSDFNNHMNRLIAACDTILGIKPATPGGDATSSTAATRNGEPAALPPAWQILLAYATVPTIAILLLFYLIVIKFDLNNNYMRAALTAASLVAGFLLSWQARHGVGAAVLLGAFTAIVSVLGMLTVVGFVDGAPIIPTSLVDWQESFEYAATIALATVVGNVLARIVPRGRAVARGS